MAWSSCVQVLPLHAPLSSPPGLELAQRFRPTGQVGLPNSGDEELGVLPFKGGSQVELERGCSFPESPSILIC